MTRKCIFCEQPVKEQPKHDKIFGTGDASDGYVHATAAVDGVPNCGRQFLPEHMTFTEGSRGTDDDT